MNKLNQLIKVNTEQYLYPPSWDEIQDFITEVGVSYNHFERFYGIPFNQLTQIKSGAKKLAPQYWHFIYQRIIPTYGVGFTEEYTLKRTKKSIPKLLPSTLPIQNNSKENHDRLITVK